MVAVAPATVLPDHWQVDLGPDPPPECQCQPPQGRLPLPEPLFGPQQWQLPVHHICRLALPALDQQCQWHHRHLVLDRHLPVPVGRYHLARGWQPGPVGPLLLFPVQVPVPAVPARDSEQPPPPEVYQLADSEA